MKRLSTKVRWIETEKKFGMFSSKISEVFSELVHELVQNFGYVIDLQDLFIQNRSEIYSETLAEAGALLQSRVSFIYCTEIRMTGPGGAIT